MDGPVSGVLARFVHVFFPGWLRGCCSLDTCFCFVHSFSFVDGFLSSSSTSIASNSSRSRYLSPEAHPSATIFRA